MAMAWLSGGLTLGVRNFGLFAEVARQRDLGDFDNDWTAISVGLRFQRHATP